MIKHLLSWVRLFSRRREKSYFLIKKITGYYPSDLELYRLAMTHKSSYIKDDQGRVVNNERLEFLGDAVLDAVIADILYIEFPVKREGFLTNTRSKIVNREFLNELALRIGLDRLIISTTNQKSLGVNIYGNALEALIGAVYLDQGFENCKTFILERLIEPNVNIHQVAMREKNYKSRLIEWAQKNKHGVSFELVNEVSEGAEAPRFVFEVLIDGASYGRGSGTSKKVAQQEAAKETLRVLGFLQ